MNDQSNSEGQMIIAGLKTNSRCFPHLTIQLRLAFKYGMTLSFLCILLVKDIVIAQTEAGTSPQFDNILYDSNT